MARSKLKFTSGAIRKLMFDPAVVASLAARGEAVAAACNGQSSWGGYQSAVSTDGSRPRARVWNIKQGAADDESRNQRMIRNLDAGR